MILMAVMGGVSVARDRHLCRDNSISLMKLHELFQTLVGGGGTTALTVWQTSDAQRCAG
jgi:hypothetical protein